jgi:hypothetical protein
MYSLHAVGCSANVNREMQKLCLELLIQSLESLSPLLNFGLAQLKFEEVYPRLRMKSTATTGPDTGLLSSINVRVTRSSF